MCCLGAPIHTVSHAKRAHDIVGTVNECADTNTQMMERTELAGGGDIQTLIGGVGGNVALAPDGALLGGVRLQRQLGAASLACAQVSQTGQRQKQKERGQKKDGNHLQEILATAMKEMPRRGEWDWAPFGWWAASCKEEQNHKTPRLIDQIGEGGAPPTTLLRPKSRQRRRDRAE
jgi:hypothetical protein